jgi:hypothetical protein
MDWGDIWSSLTMAGDSGFPVKKPSAATRLA